jgi:sugar phosphate isomerase/epimerase
MNASRLAVPIHRLASDFRRGLAVATELGVGGIEIDGRHGMDLLALSDTGIRQIRKWLDDAGLRVAAVSFFTRGGYADEDRLEARVQATKRALGQAQRLGAAVLLGRLGEIPSPEAGDAWQLLVDVLADIGRTSQQVGATFCAEAGSTSPDDLLRVLAAVPAGSLQVDLVTGALLVHGHDPTAAAESLAADLGYLHATDALPGAFAGQGRAAPLGSGHVDLPPVLATLDERGYRGWIGLESVTATRPGDAAAELAAAVEWLSRL